MGTKWNPCTAWDTEVTRRMVVHGLGASGLAAAATVGISHSLAATAQGEATPSSGLEERAVREVYSFEARFTDIIPIGLVPDGIRLDLPYTGSVVAGPLAGSTVQGTDYLLIRPDGVGVMDVRTLLTTPDEQFISAQAYGYVHMPAGVELPPPDVLLSPDFTWPDMETTIHGFQLYETGSADLAWLNRTVLAVRGAGNLGTRALRATGYAVHPIPELAPE